MIESLEKIYKEAEDALDNYIINNDGPIDKIITNGYLNIMRQVMFMMTDLAIGNK